MKCDPFLSTNITSQNFIVTLKKVPGVDAKNKKKKGRLNNT